MFDCILIGYYTVLCTTWKYIVRVGIVLKTRIRRDAGGQYGFSMQYRQVQYLQINTWAFPYWPGYHPETPILARDAVWGVKIWTVYFRSYWSYKNAFI